MKVTISVLVIIFLNTITILVPLSVLANNYKIEKKHYNKLSNDEIIMLSDTVKTILLYSVSNITDKTMAKIEVQLIVRRGKVINAFAKVLENNIDSVNSVKKLTLSIENDFVILQVKLNDELEPFNKIKQKWVGDVSASIFLGLNKDGNIKSFTFNNTIDDSNLRFGGDFLDQTKGVFRTKSLSLK